MLTRHCLRSEENGMTRTTVISVLLVAAVLEAGGDALMRTALHTAAPWPRLGCFSLAAVVLFVYGWTVNAPPWDFGQLLGLYVVFFFVVAQLIAWLVFKQQPSTQVLLGGALIVSRGIVVSLAKA